MNFTQPPGKWLAVVVLGIALAACGGEDDAGTATATNSAPTISGKPVTTATLGVQYTFQPLATDVDGNVLTFSIVNRPTWAMFDSNTGLLQGTPTAAHTQTYSDIVISVSDGEFSTALASFPIAVSDGLNRAPTISGTPSTAVMHGTQYSFAPTATDPDADTLTFSIVNQPAWATFSTSTGELQGTPGPGDVGTTSGVVITVNDGALTAALAVFDIAVQAVGTGSVTLSWMPPTENTDGSPLVDLAGYKIYWGPTQGNYPNSVTLTNPGLTAYVVENLLPGTYFFTATALNRLGVESSFAAPAAKTIP